MQTASLMLLTALALTGCSATRQSVQLPQRDTPRLVTVAEALLRDDGFRVTRREPGLGSRLETKAIILDAEKDNANVVQAAKKEGVIGVLGHVFLNDRSSATFKNRVQVILVPNGDGHRLETEISSSSREPDGSWASREPLAGYSPATFARRLQRAYGDGPSAFETDPAPAAPQAASARSAPVNDAPPAKAAPDPSKRSIHLFGQPKPNAP
jgi:hypothetical protein